MGGDSPAKAQLRALLAGPGILQSTAQHPVVHRDGSVAPWMFYSWNVTLTPDGLRLAAECLLERLAGFRSTQLAAHGMTGLPLLAGCLGLAPGRYTGVAIRHARKAYLSGRLVEGPLDPSRSVVVIDDSLSSGRALYSAITALEREGCTVEGALTLVHFPNRGGLEWASAAGYRVESLFDITEDLGQPLYPAYRPLPPPPTEGRLPDGLPPAVLARRVAEHFLATGTRPEPPPSLDRDYDARGGVFVSFRRRDDDHRLAREGRWHFDGEPAAPAADVIDATITTLRVGGGAITLANLGALKVGVTFLGPMEEIAPRQLDFARYAIVVRDLAGLRAGGALPNTQVFTSERDQYVHAWQRNARIGASERHRLYRQVVDKSIEPGQRWPAYGSPDPASLGWASSSEVGRSLTGWARRLLSGDGDPPAGDLGITSPIEGMVVGAYRQGTLGTAVAWGSGPPGALLAEAVQRLRPLVDCSGAAVMAGVLHQPERIAEGPSLAARKLRKGLDTVRVDGLGVNGGTATALPGALVYNGLSKEELIASLHRAVATGPAVVTTFRTELWLDDASTCRRLRSGFPVRDPATRREPEAAIRALSNFTVRNLGSGAVPLYKLDIVSGQRTWRGTGPRQLHALMGLGRAGALLGEPSWRAAAGRGLATFLSGVMPGFAVGDGGPLADAILLAAVGGPGQPLYRHPALVQVRRRVLGWLDPFGRIAAQPVRLGVAQDIEYLPGAVLVALAADPALLAAVEPSWFGRSLAWHRHRFRVLRTWGQLGWQLQGWGAVWQVQRRDEQADFVFELADWAIDRQLDKDGAFLEDLSPTEPSFNTGFIAEGIAAAWGVARAAGEAERAGRYQASWRAANGFLCGLLVEPEDTFICADAAEALGGVRLTPSVAQVRADSVSHWLNALVSGASLLSENLVGLSDNRHLATP